MSSERLARRTTVEAFDAAVPEMGDRGVREVAITDLAAHLAFGRVIREYQADHPDTLVRVTSRLSSRGTGSLTVRWWQRGTEMPR